MPPLIKLSDKQEAFCREYLNDYNATQAAIRAGYSQRSAHAHAWEIISNPAVRARIEELKQEYFEQLELDSYYVLARLKQIVERAMQEKQTRGKDGKKNGTSQFNTITAIRALELIGKYLGMFPNSKTHITITPEEIQNMNDDELERFARKLGIQIGSGQTIGVRKDFHSGTGDSGSGGRDTIFAVETSSGSTDGCAEQ
ncbi:MAG TPA: terminase small subunit [Candidatus Kapabacteria bacterium]|nr:terminase small subunit [Candidatus Kapabacteria bacterium]